MAPVKKKTVKAATVEMVEVVDKADKVIGKATREEAIAKNLRYRIVHVLLVNDVGNIVVQWRAAHKVIAPRVFTASVAGGVELGESYQASALRELQEEMGVAVKGKTALQEVGRFQVNQGRPVNGMLYALAWDGDLKGWEEEADAIDFWSREEAEYMLKRFPYLLANSFQASLKLFLKETE